ncbi:hypothetical protein SDC9_118746 [bioreactor metagenome]|uniref:Uncharacterized protein n=1 Tax=bioreactor metagenome TaxID=1076179 RepID=A0A645C2L7_9ZZZZ
MGGHAALAQHNGLDLGAVGEHGEHDVAALANLRIGGGLGARRDNLLHGGLVQVADEQVGEAALKDVFGHGLTHDAKTDQSDFHF